MKTTRGLALLPLLLPALSGCSSPVPQSEPTQTVEGLFVHPGPVDSKWVSFENPRGEKGKGGWENNGAKGHPSELLKAGETKTLLDVEGPGIVNRIWMTISDRSNRALRGLVIRMYWDGEAKPAVAVPLGDFFGIGLGKTVAFENALFANPEGRSFVSYVQMPFRKSARIELANEMESDVAWLFYDVNLQTLDRWDESYLYFHAYWHREMKTVLEEDFAILPRVSGRGRFLGTNMSVQVDPAYGDSWWGEGEVKIYLDGDENLPSLVGTGTEDYIGTGWGQGVFFTRYSGCSIADTEKHQYSFYRLHIPDPVYFGQDCKVTIQQMGGTTKKEVIELMKKKVPLVPVTIVGEASQLIPLYKKDTPVDLEAADLPGPEAWTNFYRTDDVAATAYFYLDRPAGGLPELQGIDARTQDLR